MIMNVNNPRDDEFIRWKWMIGMEVDDRDWIGLDWIGLDWITTRVLALEVEIEGSFGIGLRPEFLAL